MMKEYFLLKEDWGQSLDSDDIMDGQCFQSFALSHIDKCKPASKKWSAPVSSSRILETLKNQKIRHQEPGEQERELRRGKEEKAS